MNMTSGLYIFQDPKFLLVIAGAVFIGVIFGSLPGVSASMGITLGIPFTASMTPVQAIAFMVAIYCAAITGGGITAILFKIPGTNSAAATTFDGYPMAQRGEAGRALGLQLYSSAFGGIISALALFFICPQLTQAALKFGPSEMFAISFMGLSILTSLEKGSMNNTIISAVLGMLLGCVGMDLYLGTPRLTFNTVALMGGFVSIPVMVGMFAVSQIIMEAYKPSKMQALSGVDADGSKINTKMPSLKEIWSLKWINVRCAILGTIVGILPGAGASIASFLGYGMEVKLSKTPELFGTGIPEGIASCETANNGATGGAMVPMLSLGIPGGNAAAIMISALALMGVTTGPMLLVNHPEYLSATFGSMMISNILMVVFAIIIAKIFSKLLSIPYWALGSVIAVLASVGALSVRSSIFDFRIMIVCGIFGFIFKLCDMNIAAFVLGFVLGPLCEGNLRRTFVIYGFDLIDILSRPITGVVMAFSMFALFYPVISMYVKKYKAEKAAKAGE